MAAGADNEIAFLDIPGEIKLTRTDIKKCTGYYDLAERLYRPCPDRVDLTGADVSQCAQCRVANGFGLCLGCNGDRCRADNPRGVAFCQQPHVVYLAAFPGRVKVGTAAAYRGLERMREQGAIVSVFFAQTPDGQIARRLEQAVSDLGIAKNINGVYKMSNLIFDRELTNVRQGLAQKLNDIRPKIAAPFAPYFIEPEFNVFSDIYRPLSDCLADTRRADLFGEPETVVKDYDKVTDAKEISGDIKAVIGGLMVTENNPKIAVVSLKSWEGYMTRIEK